MNTHRHRQRPCQLQQPLPTGATYRCRPRHAAELKDAAGPTLVAGGKAARETGTTPLALASYRSGDEPRERPRTHLVVALGPVRGHVAHRPRSRPSAVGEGEEQRQQSAGGSHGGHGGVVLG